MPLGPPDTPAAGRRTILGIDPGLADTGVGLITGEGQQVRHFAYGSIHTDKRRPLGERLERIYRRLRDTIAESAPGLIVVEDVFSLKRYPKSGILLGKVTGVVLLAGQRCGVPTLQIPVREAKQILTGNGNASKAQLEVAVRHTLGCGDPIRPTHAADALGLALIGLFRYAHLAAAAPTRGWLAEEGDPS
ncbi:MAG: crossover junction endodeoxyribonuclease RuvC [Desulfosarcinaceae bacterium]|nr:crossover junction endodeoxyribonuclease RuvC [Desulfosarcinaceae bacterium]